MATNQHALGPTTIGLTLSGVVMILTGVSVAGLVLAAPTASGFDPTSTSVVSLALALLPILAGIECLRRRHFLFAVLVPATIAMGDATYAVAFGQMTALVGGAILLAVVILVASSRSAFRD